MRALRAISQPVYGTPTRNVKKVTIPGGHGTVGRTLAIRALGVWEAVPMGVSWNVEVTIPTR
jgi:hypothetical protein